MKSVLALGAGLVARPMVRYLLEKADVKVILADVEEQKARDIIENHPNGTAVKLDINDKETLIKYILQSDIVISLLPWTMHPAIAALCLEYKKHLVTASYVSDKMRAMDAEAKEKGLLFLNEIGVDPGIDHMAAMKVIDEVKKQGGEIESFFSYCGGLPSFKSNNNPFGYKFSWSPEGALLAAKNSGKFLFNGKVIEVPAENLFKHYWLIDVPNAGTFEAYLNRDALPYLDIYDIKTAKTIYRGTLRNVGHCESWDYFKKLGLLDEEKEFDFSQVSPSQVLAQLVEADEGYEYLEFEVAKYLMMPLYSTTIKKMEWLGLFSDKKLDIGKTSVFKMFAHLLQKKLVYMPGETDLLVQHHEFRAKYPENRKEFIASTMVDTGTNSDSSMSRTVGLPVAIASKLIAQEKIDLKGVHIPVLPQIYEPVLAELGEMNIKFNEFKYDL